MIFYYSQNKIQADIFVDCLRAYLKLDVQHFSYQDKLYDFKPSLILLDGAKVHSKTLKKVTAHYQHSPKILISDTAFKNIDVDARVSEDASIYNVSKICRSFLEDKSSAQLSKLRMLEEVILKQIYHGKSNREIARHLGFPISKVKYYLRRIYDQLNVENRTQAAMIARDIIL